MAPDKPPELELDVKTQKELLLLLASRMVIARVQDELKRRFWWVAILIVLLGALGGWTVINNAAERASQNFNHQAIADKLVTDSAFGKVIAATVRKPLEDSMKGLEKKIVDLRLEVVSGQKIYAAKNASDQNWGVTSSCGDGFVVIGYYCEIESGGGLLQNIGVRNNMYHCLWANVSGNFRAYGQAACLRIQQK